LFGSEEIELIIPVLEKARSRGINIVGPLPPDTAFLPAIRQDIDAYICLYHDQGLIPLKTLAFDLGVNVTLGLPIIRTSVDHGTAFDIAGRGIASVSSLSEATKLAQKLTAS
ncbi:MAG: 4-hydroxythreonine-4-phosphate dehydrogenase PdxA, partial [Verrucomicrobia bacterium]|nr:4-hydroxythreonine-4-phosphate dehydrogenase PdxA [Verrucomicrobiota bacterium]